MLDSLPMPFERTFARSACVTRATAGLLLLLCTAGCGAASEEAPLTVAVVGSWTGEEDWQPLIEGVAAATAEYERTAPPGARVIRFEVIDDGYGAYDIAPAATAARRIMQDPAIVAIIGHNHSQATTAGAYFYGDSIAVLAPHSFPGSTEETSVFGVGEMGTATVAAQFASRRGWRSAALLFDNTPHGRALAAAVRAEFRGAIVLDAPLRLMTDSTYEVYAAALRRREVDGAFAFVGRSNAVPFMRVMTEQLPTLDVIGNARWADLSCDSAGRTSPSIYVPTYGGSDAGRHPSTYVFGYDAMTLVAAAVSAGHRTRREIRSFVNALQADSAVEGLSGPLYFADDGRRLGALASMRRLEEMRSCR